MNTKNKGTRDGERAQPKREGGEGRQKCNAVLASLAEEIEGERKIFCREPALLGKTVRRQVIRITVERCLVNLDEALLGGVLQVSVGEAERDVELRAKLRWVTLLLRSTALSTPSRMTACRDSGRRRIALYGAGGLAEVAVLSAAEAEGDIICVIDRNFGRARRADLPVVTDLQRAAALAKPGGINAILVTDSHAPQRSFAAARGAARSCNDVAVFAPAFSERRQAPPRPEGARVIAGSRSSLSFSTKPGRCTDAAANPNLLRGAKRFARTAVAWTSGISA